MNAGSREYTEKIPPKLLNHNDHTIDNAPPPTIPEIAPLRVVRFQNSEKIIKGPNAAPNPDHAKDTKLKMELLGFKAIMIPTIATAIVVNLVTRRICLSVAFLLKILRYKLLPTLEDTNSNWESAVLIVAARIPESTIPARNLGKNAFVS